MYIKKKLKENTCVVCNKLFLSKFIAKCCSNVCRYKLSYADATKREQMKCNARRWQESNQTRSKELQKQFHVNHPFYYRDYYRSRLKRSKTEKKCVCCGISYMTFQTKSKYCSRRCCAKVAMHRQRLILSEFRQKAKWYLTELKEYRRRREADNKTKTKQLLGWLRKESRSIDIRWHKELLRNRLSLQGISLSKYKRDQLRPETLKKIVSQAKRRRYLRKHELIEQFTQAEWLRLRDSCNGICPGCKCDVGNENLTIDHKIPISKALPGTIYTIDDIQPLCRRCNSIKGDIL